MDLAICGESLDLNLWEAEFSLCFTRPSVGFFDVKSLKAALLPAQTGHVVSVGHGQMHASTSRITKLPPLSYPQW